MRGKSIQLDRTNLSTVGLNALGKLLQQERCSVQAESKEIKNQIELRKQIEKKLQKNCEEVRIEAENLSKNYEIEKEKHKRLSLLVAHYEQAVSNIRLDRKQEQIDRDQNQILKGKEREISKILQKFNHSGYDITKKMDTIRSLRSQRTVFSTLFHKIEKQLSQLEHSYKILVIQRKVLEKNYNQKLHQFSIQEERYKKIEPFKDTFNFDNNFSAKPLIRQQSITFHKKQLKQPNIQHFSSKTTVQQNNYNCQKEAESILNDFNAISITKLPSNCDTVEQDCQRLRSNILSMDDEIDRINQQIEKIHKLKLSVETKGRSLKKTTPNLKNISLNLQQEITTEKKQLTNLLNQLRQLKLVQPKQYLNDVEEMQDLLTILSNQVMSVAVESKKQYPRVLRQSTLLKSIIQDQSEDNMRIFDEYQFTAITKDKIRKMLSQ